jgi:hypothetical protein
MSAMERDADVVLDDVDRRDRRAVCGTSGARSTLDTFRGVVHRRFLEVS